MDTNHPTIELLFYIADDIDDENDVLSMKTVVNEVGASRSWIIAPPVFVNESAKDNEAGELRTVGGVLRLFSALPPWGDVLSPDIDRAHLAEVKAVIGALIPFSETTKHEIAFEVDGVPVGWIERGVVGKSLNEGLLIPWERSLAEPDQ
jgi:hypothetical protein